MNKQNATRSLFEMSKGHTEPFYSCYINDPEHYRKVGYVNYSLQFKSFYSQFSNKVNLKPSFSSYTFT